MKNSKFFTINLPQLTYFLAQSISHEDIHVSPLLPKCLSNINPRIKTPILDREYVIILKQEGKWEHPSSKLAKDNEESTFDIVPNDIIVRCSINDSEFQSISFEFITGIRQGAKSYLSYKTDKLSILPDKLVGCAREEFALQAKTIALTGFNQNSNLAEAV